MSSSPTIRTRNPERSKALILEAATSLFRSKGYNATSIREIAAHAAVNSALIRHYFGSKHSLLKEVISRSISIHVLNEVIPSEFGSYLVDVCLRRDLRTYFPLLDLLVSAEREVQELTNEVVTAQLIPAMVRWMEVDHAEDRAKIIALYLSALTAYRKNFRENCTSETDDFIRDWMANSLQALVNGQDASSLLREGAIGLNNQA